MKITFITFLVGCIAISGLPPFSGFFSKDAILISAFENNRLLYVVALLGALLTAFYMFRLLFITFTGQFRGTDEQKKHLHESPAAITIPLIILAILSLAGGWIGIPELLVKGGDQFTAFLSPVIPVHSLGSQSHPPELMLMFLSTGLIILVIIFAWTRFRNYKAKEPGRFGKILENKWYVDELFDKIIVNPIQKFAGFLNKVIENSVIDRIVNGVGRSVHYSSRQLRLLQSGQVGSYILLMVLAMLLIFVLQFFLRK